jgi:hypothetical protein
MDHRVTGGSAYFQLVSITVGEAHSKYRGEVNTKFSWGNLKERDHLEDLDVDVCIITIKSNL